MRITTLIVNIRMYHFNEIICTATLSFAYDNVSDRNLVSFFWKWQQKFLFFSKIRCGMCLLSTQLYF